MGLRSGKNDNRKLNRADTGRSTNRRADFYDLRNGSGAESDHPAGEGERYYEDEFTEDANNGGSYGTVGRYPDFTNYTGSSERSGSQDERPYRERHRVEMNDGAYTSPSGGYYADRGPEVPSINRNDSRRTNASGYERDRYGTGSSASYGAGSSSAYGTGGSASYGAGSSSAYGTESSASYGAGSSASYGTGNRVVRGNVPANRRDNGGTGTEREISADLFVPNTFSANGRRSRVTRSSRESMQDSRGGSYRGGASDNSYRGRSTDGSYRGGASDNSYRDRSTDGSYRGGASDNSYRGRSTDNSYRGGASDNSYRGRSADSSYRGGTFDNSYRGRSTDGNYRGGASNSSYHGNASGSTSAGAGSDRWRNSRTGEGQTQENYAGFYSAPGNLSGSRRSSGTGTGNYYRRDRGAGRRGDTDPGRDYFYEEELPADNMLWDGIEGDPDETPAQKRARQRERVRQEREKELRKMYFRLGAGAAVALVAVIVVIVIAVIGLRKKDDNAVAAGSGTEQTTVASGNDTDSSAGSGPEGGVEEGNPPQTEETSGDEDFSLDARDNQEETADGPQDASAETAEKTDTTGTDTENGGQQEDTAGQEENTAADTENPAEQGNTQLSPTDSWTEEARQGIAADGNGAGVSYTRQDEWNLILVNPWHKLPEGYTVETTTLLNGESIDSRCYSALSQMLNDCQEQSGGIPIVCSSYRPHEKQVLLYDDQVKSLMGAGKTKEEAEKEAGTVVAVPGTSEHELGLAVDICDSENQLLDESQENTDTQKWLMENCWKYGFILRYPRNKSAITGIIYEPWHYRYVGNEVAKEIQERGICLEEYLAE